MNNTTQCQTPAMWVSRGLLSSALSQLASQLCWVEERPVNHPDLNDPKGPGSLGLDQFWTSLWLFVDGFALCHVCVSVYTCVHGDGHPLQIYNRASVVQYQTREGELVRLSSWDLLLLSCQGKLRNFNIVWEKGKLKRTHYKHSLTSCPGGFESVQNKTGL